jgi:hypothetical protein
MALSIWFSGSAEAKRNTACAHAVRRWNSNYAPAAHHFRLPTFDFRLAYPVWWGKSWLRQDNGNMLSYDLATHFVSLAAQDFDAFRKFANAAKWEDAGVSAAREHLGYPVAHLAEAVLGEGPWQPSPEMWKEGIKKGQFSRFPEI